MMNLHSLAEYIRETKKESNFSIYGISIFVDLENVNNLDYKSVVSKMTSVVPSHLYRGLDKIIIGPSEKLTKRKLQGMYNNRNIYLTGKQPSESEILDDLIHEVSHHVEKIYDKHIYSDNKIKKEFLNKRMKLKRALEMSGIPTMQHNFENEKYSIEFDEYLYLTVGYKNLGVMSSTIFYSPYAATSLKEYFANGFEAFYMKEELTRLKKISPQLYKKIILLNNGGNEDV